MPKHSSSYWLVCTQLPTNLSLAAFQHPIILGSDKTVVSVATGHVEYHPVYLSIGLVHNTIRHGHQNAVILIGFLTIPKCMLFYYIQWSNLIQLQADRKYNDDISFRKLKCQMYHDTIHTILSPLKSGMITPVVRRYADRHFHQVIYDLAAYIADYLKQVYLAGIVQMWCPKYCCSSSSVK